MKRKKLVKEYWLPLKGFEFKYLHENGELGSVKYVNVKPQSLLIEDEDGQCYLRFYDRLFVPVKGKFDDIEGEEITSGNNSSDTEE